MARTPRARRTIEEEFAPDVVDTAVEQDREATANDLATVLESIAGITGRDLKILIYRIPKGIGKWEYCTEVQPPFETSELMDVLKEQFGPGDYAMRVMVEGKIRTTRNFSIAQDRKLNAAQTNGGMDKELLPLLITTMNGKSSETMQMMTAMMQQQAQQSQQQMQMMMAMMQQSQASQATMITALMGGREKPAELIAAFAPLMAPKTGGFGETLELLKVAKEIMGGGEKSGDGDIMDMVKTLAPVAGDVVKGIAASIPRRSETHEVRVLPQQTQPAPVHPQISGPTEEAPQGAGRFPLLTAIRDDVLFYYTRGMDPEFAAEGIAEVLDKAGFKPETDLAPIVAAFLSSPNWLVDLANEGIDLTGNPEWAHSFLNALIAIYSGEADDPGGAGGSEEDATDHGDLGEAGSTVDTGSE